MTSLAIADIGVGIQTTFAIHPSITECWPYGDVACRLTGGLQFMLCGISIHSLWAISIERYLAINYPLRYPFYATTQRSYICIALICTVNLAWVTLLVSRTDPSHYSYGEGVYVCLPQCNKPECAKFNATSSTVFGIIPQTTMILIYSKIMYVSWKQNKVIAHRKKSTTNGNSCVFPDRSKLKRKFRSAKLACMVTGASLIAWTPFVAWRIFASISSSPVTSELKFAFTWLGFSNSLWNFVMYSATSTAFRESLKRIFMTVCSFEKHVCRTINFNKHVYW
uniref:Beta-4C adrenergic receptor-like n=1 Tax=Saccoglossus kowalevskii TaxID=10224 RepID=A0ABM0M784_SACKO|nr:PREDICTED: beta-4C adrenergic receptor-like [Saccoglossus kowalevskii]